MNILKFCVNNTEIHNVTVNNYARQLMTLGKLSLNEYSFLINFVDKNSSITQMKMLSTIIKSKKLRRLLFEKIPQLILDKETLKSQIKQGLAKLKYFSPDQSNAFSKVMKFLWNPTQEIFAIFGYAGTGKTTLVAEIINFLLQSKLVRFISCVAPTNKATNVLQEKFLSVKKSDYFGLQEFMTLHRLLHYETEFSIQGKRQFIKNKRGKIGLFDLVIIDECSMLSEDLINGIITDIALTKKVNQNNIYAKPIKLIFVGDPAQLPPVHEKLSKIFSNKLVKNSVLLKTIVRTNKPNMAKLWKSVRLWVNGEKDYPELCKYHNRKDVFLYQWDGNTPKIHTEWMKSYLKNNNAIILAWTNKQTQEYNIFARKKLLRRQNPAKFEINDRLVMTEFYQLFDDSKDQTNKNKFYTSDLILVKHVQVTQVEVPELRRALANSLKKLANFINIEARYNEYLNSINFRIRRRFKIWKLYIVKLAENTLAEDKLTHIIHVIHDESLGTLNHEREIIETIIKDMNIYYHRNFQSSYYQIQKKIIRPLWKEYHKLFFDSFACVDAGNSTTIHKMQSTSIKNVYVDTDDIFKNSDETEAKHLIYTAITRATNELHILIRA